jgi:hypothetical protein
MLGLGVWERMTYGDFPSGGITSKVELPTTTSNGSELKSSKKLA